MRKSTIQDMHAIAAKKGGKCLSTTYVNSQTKLEWECAKGHHWSAVPASVKSRTWCPQCAGLVAPSLAEMTQFAKSKGGMCLSTEYQNNRTKMKWRCKDGHDWEMNWTHVERGQWCPRCSDMVSERICRKFCEHIFGEKFPKTKPKWLVNARENRMELDGYSEKLKIACEYQGAQHYRRVKIFERTRNFADQLDDDRVKKRLCAEHSIALIEVPHTVSHSQMGHFMLKEAERLGLQPANRHIPAYTELDAFSPSLLKEMQALAKAHNGKCLSMGYVDNHTGLKWQCEEGHIFENTPAHIKGGQWCRKCEGLERGTIEQMHELAKRKGGVCLSKVYVNNRVKLRWRCDEGHEWEAAPSGIKGGDWCARCSGMAKKTIDDMRRLAESHEGKCLSGVYVGVFSPLKWQCKYGHTWEVAPHSMILRKTWCPHCAHNVRLTIEDMHKTAERMGGKCLSTVYVNSQTKLRWRCNKGHEWDAIPNNVRKGQWCPVCGRKKVWETRRKRMKP